MPSLILGPKGKRAIQKGHGSRLGICSEHRAANLRASVPLEQRRRFADDGLHGRGLNTTDDFLIQFACAARGGFAGDEAA